MSVRQVQLLYGKLVQYRLDRQKSRARTLDMVSGRQCVSFSSLLQRTPHQHAKTQHTVNIKPASVTFPTKVAPGDYLVRHEMIALHPAVKLGVRVGGSPTGHPQPDRLLPRRIR